MKMIRTIGPITIPGRKGSRLTVAPLSMERSRPPAETATDWIIVLLRIRGGTARWKRLSDVKNPSSIVHIADVGKSMTSGYINGFSVSTMDRLAFRHIKSINILYVAGNVGSKTRLTAKDLGWWKERKKTFSEKYFFAVDDSEWLWSNGKRHVMRTVLIHFLSASA